ncbi:MAG: hypothetical protein V9E90_01435 [Saprospiraceae bacterium]
MATKRKSIGRAKRKTTRRKTTAKKSLGATIKAFGKTYTKKSCSRTKAAATKSANASKRAGKSAMVKKNPAGGYCVFTRTKKS